MEERVAAVGSLDRSGRNGGGDGDGRGYGAVVGAAGVDVYAP